MDRDWGTDEVREAVLAGDPPDAIVARWNSELSAFRAAREKFLLY
jgi:hypothetical protein